MGSIPRRIGNSTMLKELYLGYNHLEEIPTEICNIQLEYLSIKNNDLKGSLPLFVFNMSYLYAMTLQRNALSGVLPDDLCQHLPVIEQLYFGYNQIGGPIPSKLLHCRQLQTLSLSFNNLTGTVPRTIGNLTQLREIYISSNSLTGPMPNEIGDLRNLEILSLAGNRLSGPIPFRIFNISTLIVIQLNVNELSGSLPSKLGRWNPNIEHLYVAMNHLSGPIPESISNASKLIFLEIANNSFSGPIPTSLVNLRNLQVLNLWSNDLTLGATPESNILYHLAIFKDLRIASLSFNPFDTTLPNSVGNWSTTLEHLYLHDCKLRGNLPNDIGNLTSLLALGLLNNSLSGPIPPSIGRLQNLQSLELHENIFQGSIPRELCNLESLFQLNLGNNKLSGTLPMCFGNLVGLRHISVASNNLKSIIPSSFWGLVDILHINLSLNSFSGSLPIDIGKMKAVSIMDFSHNQLSNNIPSNIGELQSLVQLNLSHNNFEGPVPDSFGNLVGLEFLDLSRNNLSEGLPKSLEGLLHLKHLNVSCNKLEGEIPRGGPFKTFSAQSFMSNKALCGPSRLQVQPCKISTRPQSQRSARRVLRYVLPTIISAILIFTFLYWFVLGRKRGEKPATKGTIKSDQDWKRVSYQELLRATNGFSADNFLGDGGFGSVYKGTLSNGIIVAIKVFNLHVEGGFKSFDVECEVLCSVRHRNIVKIISSCSNQIDFKALVLDYMPRGSLEKLLHGNEFCLDFIQRLNIMIDVASALEYLHYGYPMPIVHCDLKPSNVLLDEDLVAHVSDFGIARLLNGDDGMTHTITLATIGYMAPEYGFEGVVSRRGDVYSYGILLIETFTRRNPTDEMFNGEMSLKQWVADSFPDKLINIVDSNLLRTEEENYGIKMDCVSSILELALSCAAESPEDRINMQDVVAELKKIKMKYLKASNCK